VEVASGGGGGGRALGVELCSALCYACKGNERRRMKKEKEKRGKGEKRNRGKRKGGGVRRRNSRRLSRARG
jgi:hypothetical protein